MSRFLEHALLSRAAAKHLVLREENEILRALRALRMTCMAQHMRETADSGDDVGR